MNVEEYPEIETDFPGGMEQCSPAFEEDYL